MLGESAAYLGPHPTWRFLSKSLVDSIRIVIPVSGLLFAFLLVMPFNSLFVTVTETDQKAYSFAFLAAGLATIFLVAVGVHPVVRRARRDQVETSDEMVRQLTRIAVAGLVLLAIAFVAVVFLITDQVYHNGGFVTVAVASFIAAIAFAWVILPSRAKPADGPKSRANPPAANSIVAGEPGS
ncbi:DUF6328 family protein [Candidatus Nanopelagicales bacterium]|nr:DUF6328 family protein [Candidatus Nanopelagicales bacterium]